MVTRKSKGGRPSLVLAKVVRAYRRKQSAKFGPYASKSGVYQTRYYIANVLDDRGIDAEVVSTGLHVVVRPTRVPASLLK